MPITNPSAIVDAVQNDLAGLGLNPAKTWSYVEPVVIVPETCPLLAVWCQITDYDILTGAKNLQAFERKHQVVVEWVVYSSTMADTGGTGDPATVKALDAVAEALVGQIATYASGLPGGLGPQMVGTLSQRLLIPKAGSVWAAQVHFVAEEAS